MTEPDGQLEAYLKTVRSHLGGLTAAEAAETVEELRCHVLDRVEEDPGPDAVARALAALGDPQALARINVGERVASRARGRSSPLALLATTAQLAALSLRGLLTFFVCILGYGLALVWIACAAIKPFAPGRVGLWHVVDPADDLTFSLSFIGRPGAGHELLGWWIIPIGLLLGAGIGALTHLFARRSIRRIAGARWGGER